MHFVLTTLALTAVVGLAAPVSKQARGDSDGNDGGLADVLSNLEGYLPLVGGNEGPLIPGLGKKLRRGDSDGNNGGLADVLSNLEGYLPIVGGNEGPLIPGSD